MRNQADNPLATGRDGTDCSTRKKSEKQGDMTETKTGPGKKTLKLGDRGKLELRKSSESGQVRQSFSHGRTKAVTVEVKRKRMVEQATCRTSRSSLLSLASPSLSKKLRRKASRTLTRAEREIRERVLRSAIAEEEEERRGNGSTA